MIEALLPPMVAALALLPVLAYLGLRMLSRHEVTTGLALTQLAALGATLAAGWGVAHGAPALVAAAFGTTLAGAAVFARAGDARLPREVVAAIAFTVAGAATLLVAGTGPDAAAHVRGMLAGSLLGLGWRDALGLVVVAVVLGALLQGLERSRGSFAFHATLGLALAVSVVVAGALAAFAMLVVPAALARLYVERARPALVLATVAGGLALMIGVTIASGWGLPAGPTVVGSLGLALVVACLFQGCLRVWVPGDAPFAGERPRTGPLPGETTAGEPV